MVPLRVPEMYFWPAKTGKNLELFEKHTCHWPGAQRWFRHKWRKLVTASLLLLCIDGYILLRYWNEFFFSCVSGLDWSFLVLHFDGNVCNWIPKVIWTLMDWFWGLLLGNGFFRWLHICNRLKSARIAKLLFFFHHIKFFRCLVWGVFWSSYVCASSIPVFPQIMIGFRQDCIACELR